MTKKQPFTPPSVCHRGKSCRDSDPSAALVDRAEHVIRISLSQLAFSKARHALKVSITPTDSFVKAKAKRKSRRGKAERFHCRKGNLLFAKHITHRNTEKRELYGILLPHHSLFCFYRRSRTCISNARGKVDPPVSNFPIRIPPLFRGAVATSHAGVNRRS